MTNIFTYSSSKFKFLDNIVLKKRKEMFEIIKKSIDLNSINSVLDVGTTSDNSLQSSNFLIKQLKSIKIKKSISDQKILNDDFFDMTFEGSITENLNDSFENLKSDLIVCSATIEHLGNFSAVKKGIDNIVNLTNKYFIITTPNRHHPIEFHTKIPFIHFLPKEFYRKLLEFFGNEFFSKEENLNLLSKKDLINLMSNYKNIYYNINEIKLFGFVSNFIIVGTKK
jgi:hypothetical protein